MKNRVLTVALFVALLAAVTVPDAHAQRADGAVGLGVQAGSPTGLSLKFHQEPSPSYDVLVAWDLDEFFFVNAHALFEQNIPANNLEPGQDLEWFIGPGVFVGARDDVAALGASGTIGISFTFADHFEAYGRLTPRLELVEETDLDAGGGIGLRYFF